MRQTSLQEAPRLLAADICVQSSPGREEVVRRVGDIGMAVTLGWHESLLGSNDFKLGIYPILGMAGHGWMDESSFKSYQAIKPM
ncbi:hypothetical protein B8W95_12750 [Staphylococcus pasteuri]|nr:hypothetical protein B8W95_12750 [Staphylococcus pasteuri]